MCNYHERNVSYEMEHIITLFSFHGVNSKHLCAGKRVVFLFDWRGSTEC